MFLREALGARMLMIPFEAILDNRYDSLHFGNHVFGVTSLKRFYAKVRGNSLIALYLD